MYNAATNQKIAGVATLISHRAELGSRTVIREKGCYIITERIILQKDITILNVHASNSENKGMFGKN